MSDDPFAMSGDYGDLVQAKLQDVLQNTPSQKIGQVIRKVIENLVLTERIALDKGIDIGALEKREIMQRDYEDIQSEVDRALGEFIGSILSAEGG